MATFTYDEKDFLLDGCPFQILSGAMHYWRIPADYWEDRLQKLKECGFNTVETYTPWNLHERKEGIFDFSGDLDIVRYIETAERLGLKVIVRPGPYICSEFEFGGLPSWLLSYPQMHLRCNDPQYLAKVRPYYHELLSRIRPHLCTQGGGILMVQVENEYGSYGDDKAYLRAVSDIYREEGIDCLLFTSDGPCYSMLNGGTLPDTLCVANFGSRPREAFTLLSDFRPGQPSMCGEFWCGWFDHWGEEHHIRTPEETVRDVKTMLEMGASFNFYMFHGGTNFGFTNGANHTETEYQPTVTSYDYCAPLSEAGDLTPTYHAVREVLTKHTGVCLPLTVKDTPKAAYGKVALTERAPLFANLKQIGQVTHAVSPLSMEEVGQDFGYILYSTTFHGPHDARELVLTHMHDRALVYKDGDLIAVRERTGRMDPIPLQLGKGESVQLDILVENCGRVNYGPKLFDHKGIFGGVRLGGQYHFGWDITSLTMDDLSPLRYEPMALSDGHPAFLRGHFAIQGTPCDTFVALPGFHKGFVVVNGHNLGRYWNDRGPQKTLYVPAPYLRTGDNEIVVFESDGYGAPEVVFYDQPDLG